MTRLNRDVYVAVALLVFCGVMFWASFDIREPDYGVLPPTAWPRVVLILLSVLSLIYLVQSLRRGPDGEATEAEPPKSLRERIHSWRNPVFCFVLFFAYLALLPVLGMLIDGILFVFCLLGALGGFDRRSVMEHAAVALVTVGGMWSIFTFGLGVLLPTGILIEGF